MSCDLSVSCFYFLTLFINIRHLLVVASTTTLLNCQIFEDKNCVFSQINYLNMGLLDSKCFMSIIKWMDECLREETGLFYVGIFQTLLLLKYFFEIPYFHLFYHRPISSLRTSQMYYHSDILTGLSVVIFGLWNLIFTLSELINRSSNQGTYCKGILANY